MPWIFGSFLVTPCALTSCHVVISKQDSTIRALRSNRWVTGGRPRDENHAVNFRQSAENRCQTRDTQPITGVSHELTRGWVPALAPSGSWKKIWEEVLSLNIYFSNNLSHNIETSTIIETSKRYQVPFSKSLVWRDLGLNPGLSDHWRTCANYLCSIEIYIYIYIKCERYIFL